jgi:DNA-binding ferritin-like protein
MEEILRQFISDITKLQFNIHHIHFNCIGDEFFITHAQLTNDFYEDLEDRLDYLGESARKLGVPPLGNLREVEDTTIIADIDSATLYGTQEVVDYMLMAYNQININILNMRELSEYYMQSELDSWYSDNMNMVWKLQQMAMV